MFKESTNKLTSKKDSPQEKIHYSAYAFECGAFALNSINLLKQELSSLRSIFLKELSSIKLILTQITTIHKEYKSRCQNGFLEYLKNLDIDIRKILKPLVPSSLVIEQTKFPPPTSISSLRSSVQSIEAPALEASVEASIKSLPEPSEITIERLNAHIQMLVGTLETTAKDLIQVLSEADREYYQQLNNQTVYSRPLTPLAAPLPDYFCYELQDAPPNQIDKQIITNESTEIWIKRLSDLHKNHEIKDSLYFSLIKKLSKKTESKVVDLKDLFVGTDLLLSQREELVYYLLNGSGEVQGNVSMTEMMSEKKLKPEPPADPKPKVKAFFKVDKSVSPVSAHRLDKEVVRILKGSIQDKVTNSFRVASKSPKFGRTGKDRKSVRVRSITPVGQEKTAARKSKTPGVNKKVNLSVLYANHRLRKII